MTPKGIRVFVIADDLTGALDTASPFACKGLKVRVFTSAEAMPTSAPDCDVLSVSTNSRHCSAVDAAVHATTAAQAGLKLNPAFVIKKIDSRMKGNVEAECRAIAKVLQFEGICVAPAAPDVGRFVVDGHVVGSSVSVPISIAERFGSLDNLQIADTGNTDDLLQLADLLNDNKKILVACSRGFAVALADRLATGKAAPFTPKSPILIGMGSRDPVTKCQVERFQKECRCQVIAAPDGKVAESVPKADCVIVTTEGNGVNSTDVAHRLAEGLSRAIGTLRPKTILLSGGDTAAAVLERIGCREIEVCGEAAPGLPWCKFALNGASMQLISKSGGFGTETTLVEVLGGGRIKSG